MTQRGLPQLSRLKVLYRDDGPDQLVGELALGRTIAFQYDAAWLGHGLELSPEHLPLSVGREIQFPPRGAMLHGLFADALPDAWGERIMRMAFQRLGVPWSDVTELDRLAALGTRAIGALSFAPSHELQASSPASGTFETLLHTVDTLLGGDPTDADANALDRLQRVAGTAGGAQPKALVGLRESDGAISPDPEPPTGFTPYLVKLSPRIEAMNLSPASGTIEGAYFAMARAAGLTVPATRIVHTSDGRAHFAIARFDRTAAGGRRHVHSLAGLLGRAPADGFDYDELLTVTLNLTGDQRALREAFARAAFNILAGNDDDHGRNTSFLLDPVRGWALSPAYDLIFQPGRGTRGMSVLGKEKEIRRADLVALADKHAIPRAVATSIMQQVQAAVADWPSLARAGEVPVDWQRDIEKVMAERAARMFGA